jgi:transcriptional regulator with XRE-family HTH domain
MTIVKQQDHDRLELAREHLGLTRQQLATVIGISTTALSGWVNGIPSARLDVLATALSVPREWIESGGSPPHWYIMKSMTDGRGAVNWDALPLPELLACWWETFNTALLELLLDPECHLSFADHVRVRRWDFLTRQSEPLRQQLDAQQIEILAGEIGVWPKDPSLAARIRSTFPLTVIVIPMDAASDKPSDWQRILSQLTTNVRGYRKARNDHQRQQRRQSTVWDLLMQQQPGERLLSGPAIIPVLSACVRAAQCVEILFAQKAHLQTAVEFALVNNFHKRTFTLSDLGTALKQRRGINLIGRSRSTDTGRRQGPSKSNSISEDTLVRALKKIVADGHFPLHLKSGGRAWVMGEAPEWTPKGN